MNRLTIGLMSALIIGIFAGTSAAQERELPELTPEQRLDRFELNLNAMAIAAILLAQERGESAEALGAQYGRIFAPGWAEELTPAGLVEGMHRNWQMLGVRTHIVQERPDEVTARRTHPYDVEAFEQRYGDFGMLYDDMQSFFRGITQAIAEARGLTYEEEDEGEWITLTVRRAE